MASAPPEMPFYLSTRWLVGLGIKWPVQTWLDWQVKYAKYVIPIMAIRKRAKLLLSLSQQCQCFNCEHRPHYGLRTLLYQAMRCLLNKHARKKPSWHLEHGQTHSTSGTSELNELSSTHSLLLACNQFSCSDEDIESMKAIAQISIGSSLRAIAVVGEEGPRQK